MDFGLLFHHNHHNHYCYNTKKHCVRSCPAIQLLVNNNLYKQTRLWKSLCSFFKIQCNPLNVIMVNVIRLDIVITFSDKIRSQRYISTSFSSVIVIIWLMVSLLPSPKVIPISGLHSTHIWLTSKSCKNILLFEIC